MARRITRQRGGKPVSRGNGRVHPLLKPDLANRAVPQLISKNIQLVFVTPIVTR
jgi:hypothetical protein